MSRRPSARLADVARLAGVSLSTASRALASPELVHALTRERVRSAVQRLGYVPHGAARALASQRTRTIGAVFPPVDNPIFAIGTHALARELAAAGYTLLLATHDYDPTAELAATRILLERGVDGIVLVGTDHDPELFALLAKSGIPCELTWSIDSAARHHCVGISHRLASMRVAQHLLDLGHREFAVIAGDTRYNDRARERLLGVREVLAARAIALRDERVVEVPFSVAHGRRALNELLGRAPGFTALVCGNDPLAIGALLECSSRGILVPAELSIAGFDDVELAGEFVPALTTIRVPSAEIGRLAARRLLARLSGGCLRRCEELPAELVVRETTGPVVRSPAVLARVRPARSERPRTVGGSAVD